MELREFGELSDITQSRGRTPSVFVFNPFAEGYIAGGKSFTPVRHQDQLAHDLANLPQFLCRAGDIVLVHKRPRLEFLSALQHAGFAVPEFVELGGGRLDPAGAIGRRKLGGLRPWAWGPDSLELLQPLFAQAAGEVRSPGQCYNEAIARLYSKAWSAAFLRTVLEGYPQAHEAGRGEAADRARAAQPAQAPSWLCTEEETGVVVNSLDGAFEAIENIRRRGHHRVVAKEAHGLAGHNAIRLWEPEVIAPHQRWLANAVQNGRQLVIEPWLERELDFSIQLEMGPRHLEPIGWTGLVNDRKGQFQGNWAAANDDRGIPASVTAWFGEVPNISSHLQHLYRHIVSLLEAELRQSGFIGPVGIDAFVYRTSQGQCRLKPIVEINPRYTMGRLTLELMRQTSPGNCGLFRLVNRAQTRAEGLSDFVAYARALETRHPLRLDGEPSAKIREGIVCLNDPKAAQVCLATFQVGRTLGELLGGISPGAPGKWPL